MKTYEITAIKRVSVSLQVENDEDIEDAIARMKSLEAEEEIGFHTGPMIIESVVLLKEDDE